MFKKVRVSSDDENEDERPIDATDEGAVEQRSGDGDEWHNINFSVTDLGRKITLPTGSTITVGSKTEVHFLNSLVNCTAHKIRVLAPAHEEEDDPDARNFIELESYMELRLSSEPRSRVATMPGHFRDAADGRVRRTRVNIMTPQRFNGFANGVLPRISRSKCPGIIVSMPTALFLESEEGRARLDELVDAEATDLDEYNKDDEHDQPPEKRRRVAVYAPDSGPDSIIRDDNGVVGVRNLSIYRATY